MTMVKLRILVMLVLLSICTTTMARRFIPLSMDVGTIRVVNNKEVVLYKDTNRFFKAISAGFFGLIREELLLNPRIRIRNQQNLFVTANQLPRFDGQKVAVRYDRAKNIDEIWILTDAEYDQWQKRAAELKQRHKKFE